MKNQLSYLLKVLFIVSVTVLLSGCSHGLLILEGERGGVAVEKHERNPQPRHGMKKIPPGHMPPPGSCRIWYPNTPPGHQPPPGDCYTLSRNVPPGAWLIRG